MPITGIPLVLENLILSVLETHELGTWNIFSEKDGNVTFRLRFKMEGQGQTYRERGMCASYRKKSPKQICRDQSRALMRREKTSHNRVCNEEYLEGENMHSAMEIESSILNVHAPNFQPQEIVCESVTQMEPTSPEVTEPLVTCNSDTNSEEDLPLSFNSPVLEEDSDDNSCSSYSGDSATCTRSIDSDLFTKLEEMVAYMSENCVTKADVEALQAKRAAIWNI